MLFAAATTSATPWWGVPVVAGGFTLLGVLIGQAVAYVAGKKVSETQARRERDEVTREASLALLAAAAAFAGNPKADGAELTHAYARLQMVAPDEILSAAGKLQATAIASHEALSDRKSSDDDAYKAGYNMSQESLAFSATVRRELGAPK